MAPIIMVIKSFISVVNCDRGKKLQGLQHFYESEIEDGMSVVVFSACQSEIEDGMSFVVFSACQAR